MTIREALGVETREEFKAIGYDQVFFFDCVGDLYYKGNSVNRSVPKQEEIIWIKKFFSDGIEKVIKEFEPNDKQKEIIREMYKKGYKWFARNGEMDLFVTYPWFFKEQPSRHLLGWVPKENTECIQNLNEFFGISVDECYKCSDYVEEWVPNADELKVIEAMVLIGNKVFTKVNHDILQFSGNGFANVIHGNDLFNTLDYSTRKCSDYID